jgi:hypothetical protein
MTLKGKVVQSTPTWSQVRLMEDGGYITLPVTLTPHQHVEIEITPILTSGAAAGSQLQLPFAPAK